MLKQSYIIEPEKKIPVIEADVFVAGAGTAGCIAAIAAARQGAGNHVHAHGAGDAQQSEHGTGAGRRGERILFF